jgi:hypothetical protein
MSAADRLEAFAVAAALTRAEFEHDAEGRDVVMDGADHEAVCLVLARVTAGVFRAAACGNDRRAGEFINIWQDEVRRALAAIAEQ